MDKNDNPWAAVAVHPTTMDGMLQAGLGIAAERSKRMAPFMALYERLNLNDLAAVEKKGKIVWKETAYSYAKSWREACDVLDAAREMHLAAQTRIVELERQLARFEGLEKHVARLNIEERQLKSAALDREVQAGNEARRAQATFEHERQQSEAVIETLLGTLRTLALPSTPAQRLARVAGIASPITALPWGPDVEGTEHAPQGPVRMYVIRSLVQLWNQYANVQRPFSELVLEVISGASKSDRLNNSNCANDTTLARHLAERLGKKAPF